MRARVREFVCGRTKRNPYTICSSVSVNANGFFFSLNEGQHGIKQTQTMYTVTFVLHKQANVEWGENVVAAAASNWHDVRVGKFNQ